MTLGQFSVAAGCALFVGLMLFLHVVRQDLSALQRGMSRYAGRDTLAAATLAFLALGVATASLAPMLGQHGARYAFLAAAGIVLVAATPIGTPDPARAVTALHAVGGIAFYAGMLGTMFASPSHPGDRVLRWAFVAVLTVFVAGGLGMPGSRAIVGLLQRAVFTLILLWLVRRAFR